MDFKTFSSVNEGYYNDFSDIESTERKTTLAKSLERVRDRVKDQFRPDYAEKPWRSEKYDAAHYLGGKIISGILGVTAEVADLVGGAFKKGKKDDDLTKKEEDEAFDRFSDSLSPSPSQKDLENYAEQTQKLAIQRYGKKFSLNSPQNPSQENFVRRVKRGEDEIIKRMEA